MKVQLKPILTYEVSIEGQILGEFTERSRWEGFTKLQGPNGSIIGRKAAAGAFSMGEWFKDEKATTEMQVVNATGRIVDRMNRIVEEGEGEAPDQHPEEDSDEPL